MSKPDTSNKDKPIIHHTKFERVNDKQEIVVVHHYRFFFYIAKRDKYKLMDRYFYSIVEPVDNPEQHALDSTIKYKKQGRYRDFFFVEKPLNYEDTIQL